MSLGPLGHFAAAATLVAGAIAASQADAQGTSKAEKCFADEVRALSYSLSREHPDRRVPLFLESYERLLEVCRKEYEGKISQGVIDRAVEDAKEFLTTPPANPCGWYETLTGRCSP